MADTGDLELDSESNTGSTTQVVRKNISLKLKGKSRGRGRKSGRGRRSGRKALADTSICEELEEEDVIVQQQQQHVPIQITENRINLEDNISKFEAPTFSTLERGPEPLHQNKKLRWDHKVNLIGEKVINPMIHCCGKCSLPILNYGRMIPCKHVFCYDCGKKAENVCPRCEDKVQRVEQSALGTMFMCTFGGTRLGTGGCGRTYLSQRDLQAHINHRHIRPPTTSAPTTSHTQTPHVVQTTAVTASLPQVAHNVPHVGVTRDPRDPRSHGTHMIVDIGGHPTAHTPPHPGQAALPVAHLHPHLNPEHREAADLTRSQGLATGVITAGSGTQPRTSHPYPHPSTTYPSPIPGSTRPNLITVPIQDDNTVSTNQHAHIPSHPPQYTSPPASLPPAPAPQPQPHQLNQLQQHPPNAYPPPPHHYQHPLPSVNPSYSQSPQISSQSFNQPPPPVHHPPPPIRAPNPPMYSTPPPPVHHHPPPTYSNPPVGTVTHSLPPPQRFPTGSNYEENASYSQPWGSANVPPPPPSRAPLPPRPISAPPPPSNPNMGILQPCGPGDSNYRPPYYN